MPLLGRKLYEYRVDPNDNKRASFNPKELDWPFPEKFYESIGYTINRFSFEFKNAPSNLRSILNPQVSLINVENGLEEADNSLNSDLFNPAKKTIEEKIAEYMAIPTKRFINEIYFLYDKSNLIKKIVTAINKQLSLYDSFSYFSGTTTATNLKLISSSKLFKISC